MKVALEIAAGAVTVTVTERWVERWCRRWPCASVRGAERITATFDRTGLVELQIEGERGYVVDVDGHEISSLLSDALEEGRLPVTHPCFYVAVGQFRAN